VGEKFRDWTDEDPSLDVVLETVTMWWILGSYPKAIYAYAEVRLPPRLVAPARPSHHGFSSLQVQVHGTETPLCT
jgi:microsomal epoxide hydrolase